MFLRIIFAKNRLSKGDFCKSIKTTTIMLNKEKECVNQEIKLGELTESLLEALDNAHNVSKLLITERTKQKLSIMRISNIAREINDLKKIVKTIRNA